MDLQALNTWLATIDGYIGGSAWFVYLLLGTGLFFTLYLGFPQIRYFRHAWKIVGGRYDEADAKGDTTHFQSLATALSGTVGTGNIAGVAFAIHLGGPAALFWMLVTAVLGMTTKFVEVTLSHKYREFAEDGTASGGPMYYMKNKLGMKWMAVLFAIATIISSFGTGNMPQVNSIASSLRSTFGIEPWLTGAVLSVLLALIILGGIQRIAATTSKLVPAMALIYFFGVLSVILYNYQNILPALQSIFSDVFRGSSAMGGFLGASMAYAFNRGVNRGLFSNEAGQGSAPIAHAAARSKHPASEGMVAILEPFIDTVVICTLTGLALLTSGVWHEKEVNEFQLADVYVLSGAWTEEDEQQRSQLYSFYNEGGELPLFNGSLNVAGGKAQENVTLLHARSIAEQVEFTLQEQPLTAQITVREGRMTDLPGGTSVRGLSLMHSAPLTARAFKRGFLGDWGQYIVSIGLLLFAFSTAISWSYYGDRAVTFLLGSKYVAVYRVLYVLGFFLAAVVDTTLIWTFSGIAIALMTLPNLIGILMLRKDMKQTLASYWEEFKS